MDIELDKYNNRYSTERVITIKYLWNNTEISQIKFMQEAICSECTVH